MNIDDINRRRFVRNTGLGMLMFNVAGVPTWLSPQMAHAKSVELEHLSTADAALLAAFADHVLPGATSAGVVHFVDQQLGVDPQECLLICKYFPEIKAPFKDFYTTGLNALRDTAKREHDAPFTALTTAQKDALTERLWRGEVTSWNGPPPPIFYMVVRSDAVDVVYGTKEGFDELNVPYMAHIMPAEKW